MAYKKNDDAQKVEAPIEVAPIDNVSAAVHRGVDKWIDENLRNTAFSRDTAAWNVLNEALPRLAPTITKEVK